MKLKIALAFAFLAAPAFAQLSQASGDALRACFDLPPGGGFDEREFPSCKGEEVVDPTLAHIGIDAVLLDAMDGLYTADKPLPGQSLGLEIDPHATRKDNK